MNQIPAVSVLDFEVHLLMTMKLRTKISNKEAQLESKLAEHGFSLADAQDIDSRVKQALGDETSYFRNLKRITKTAHLGAAELEYTSILWPGFTFKASASENYRLDAARYWRTNRDLPSANSPTDLAIWSMDVTDFVERFGPTISDQKWSFFDNLLPAYEEHEFRWDGEIYGAGFSWGLFMFAAMSWD